MFDPASSTIISLLAIILVVLMGHGFLLGRIARALEKSSNKRNRVAMPDPTPEDAASTSISDFDRFLAEDPTRHQLAKNEQATAYRAWRKERGLTWNA